MPDEVKLEPCPRCGNRAFITGTDSYQVWCLTGKCLLLPARASRDDAIADWNMRAAIEATRPTAATGQDDVVKELVEARTGVTLNG